ncbi:MAG: TIGR03905 family TSCPD domain-containing protein [Bacteroidales bacterium]|nr:TIGR03905 family TSCPD domain-containing protein [Bacteroidales bacterium]
MNPQQQIERTDDFQIIKDETVDGIRCVTAVPSAKVCSRQIDIRIKDGVIQSVVYTRGCEGNAKGIGALIKDMTVEEAIRRLDGITCGKRGTSCPDQLARILKAL